MEIIGIFFICLKYPLKNSDRFLYDGSDSKNSIKLFCTFLRILGFKP